MRFALTDDQLDFRDAVRGLLADTCTPDDIRSAWGGEIGSGGDGRIASAWNALGEMGVLGVVVPEAHGGLGMTDEDMVPLLVECGRAGLPDPVSNSAYVAATLLSNLGATAGGTTAAATWLPKIATGAATLLVVFPGSSLVPAAESADAFLVCEQGRVSLLQANDVRITSEASVDGARSLGRVEWDEIGDRVIAEGEPAAAAVHQAFDRAALGAAAELVGLSHRMVDMTVEYAAERKQFGVPIGSFQAIKHHLADAALGVAFAEPLVMRAANSLAHGVDDSALHVSMAKVRASEAARVAASTSLQCHGAIGYTVECDLHLYMKRAWALAATYGDPDFHRDRVRSVLLGSPA